MRELDGLPKARIDSFQGETVDKAMQLSWSLDGGPAAETARP
jgi:hypothetical protein